MPIHPPFDLRVEYLREPELIDIPRPRFFWKLKSDFRGDQQTAYQVIVSSEREFCEKEVGDFWDSGKVSSQECTHIPYGGEELLSCQNYYWRVRWWNISGQVSPYSDIAVFGTGFMGTSKLRASWITMEEPETYVGPTTVLLGQREEPDIQCLGIYLRKEFKSRGRATRAMIYISGLGHYRLYFNGQRIGDRVLDPGWSDYNKVALYSAYEVTDLVREQNAVGVVLGNGRHIQKYGYGQPRLLCRLEIYYEKGGLDIITSDESWRVSGGPVRENGIYFGENYDARLEQPGWAEPGFDDSGWKKAVTVSGPALDAQNIPPIRITERLKPVSIRPAGEGRHIFDFGKNISGWARLRVSGQAGTQVQLRYGELLHPDGSLNQATCDRARATDVYILKGNGLEVYEPHFTYHGFRYVELDGFPGTPDENTLEACFVHSDVESNGQFESSSELLNRIHGCCLTSFRSNLMSIPTDCPQRDERHGWLGDVLAMAEAASYNFDLAAFYTHFLNLIRQAQKEDGSLPDFVPPYNPAVYPADPAWGSAYISLCWHLYLFYGDRDILRKHFQSLKNYIEFLRQKATGNLQLGLGKYGDWCQPGGMVPKKTPLELVATWFYYHDVQVFARICELVGRKEEARQYQELAGQIKTAFNRAYLEERQYKALRQGPVDRFPDQTANLLPLLLDLVPEEARENVLKALLESLVIRHDYHPDTGVIGTRFLFEVLDKFGLQEVALKIVLQDSYPGWGYMVREGATSLWERWEKLTGQGMNSHNHAMLGSVDAWFYRGLAGLQPIEPGWKVFEIKPYPGLEEVRCRLVTVRGEIAANWKKTDSEFSLALVVPVGTRARLTFPLLWRDYLIKESGLLIWEGGQFVAEDPRLGITLAELNREPVFWVESGKYEFVMKKA